MKKNLTNNEIVNKLQDHAIECMNIDKLLEHIAPDEYDPDRTAGDTLFGQAAIAIRKLEHIQTELAFSEFYEKQQREKALEENAKLLKFNKFLTGELNQLANFNPDWDVLMANREALREHMVILRKIWKMSREMEDEANSFAQQKRYDAAGQLDHWSGQIQDALETMGDG